MKFNIPEPCSEDWNKMKIGLNARHCDSCQKDVIDFTQQSREEILTYLLMHNGERVCGHIRRSQLDFSYNEIMFVIHGMTQHEKKSNLPFYILCMGAMLLTSCGTGTTTGKIVSDHQDTVVQTDSHVVNNRIQKQDTVVDQNIEPEVVHKKGEVLPTPPPPVGMIMTGEVFEGDIDIPEPEEVIDGDMLMEIEAPEEEILQFAEVMPEFPGGVDELMKYLRKNVRYPALERDQNIQGTVVAQFVVTELGKIEHVQIVKSVKGSFGFDREVIRVVQSMPDWKPGMQNGKAVKVRYHLPVTFKLN